MPSFQLSVSHGDSDMLTSQVWARLEPVWVWLATNMDSVEVLVRRGNNISERAPFRSEFSEWAPFRSEFSERNPFRSEFSVGGLHLEVGLQGGLHLEVNLQGGLHL